MYLVASSIWQQWIAYLDYKPGRFVFSYFDFVLNVVDIHFSDGFIFGASIVVRLQHDVALLSL